jgi:UDP-N-acetylmuramyl pentapeptide phosphotransferase/UDP-N-acetylglucosamine-1-phosphate transferase
MFEHVTGRIELLASVTIGSLLVSFGLLVLLRPWFARHAMAHPNARSSHNAPTPQGGGIAVMVAAISISWSTVAFLPGVLSNEGVQLLALTVAIILLAITGAVDDMRSLAAFPRLAVQCVAVAMILAALPADAHILPHMPWWLERACLFLGGLWLVNLVNFMDGIDWMTVVEFVPILGALTLLGLADGIDMLPALFAAALLGAVLGFAPFNKPVAKLFLGDAGSLPMGLLLGWLLLKLVEKGHLAAALILPLYYVADASITLGLRIARGERFWQAHRTHFYQRAIDRGLTVSQIVGRVFFSNVALAVLALGTLAAPPLAWPALVAAAALVAWLLTSLVRGET